MNGVTCREIARAVAVDEVALCDAVRRQTITGHLSHCRACSAFAEQLLLVCEAARAACDELADDAPDDFESRLVACLCRES